MSLLVTPRLLSWEAAEQPRQKHLPGLQCHAGPVGIYLFCQLVVGISFKIRKEGEKVEVSRKNLEGWGRGELADL